MTVHNWLLKLILNFVPPTLKINVNIKMLSRRKMSDCRDFCKLSKTLNRRIFRGSLARSDVVRVVGLVGGGKLPRRLSGNRQSELSGISTSRAVAAVRHRLHRGRAGELRLFPGERGRGSAAVQREQRVQ